MRGVAYISSVFLVTGSAPLKIATVSVRYFRENIAQGTSLRANKKRRIQAPVGQ